MSFFDVYAPHFTPPSTVRPPPAWRGCCTLCLANVAVPPETTLEAPVVCACGRRYYALDEGVYAAVEHSPTAETEPPPSTKRTTRPPAGAPRAPLETIPEVE